MTATVVPGPPRAQLISMAGGAGEDADLYRHLFASLTLPSRRAAVVGITSAIKGEGRSTVAMNLAGTLAGDLDVPVWLVEADLGNPILASLLGLKAWPGLAEVLREQHSLEDVAQPVARNLQVVTTGAMGDDAARLVRRMAQQDTFHQQDSFEGVVILDLPPVLEHGYGALAAGVADAVVLVVRANVTPANLVREAVVHLEGVPLQGTVLNGSRPALPRWWLGRRT